MRLVVEQGRLRDYRVPFFEALARRVDTLTVVHSGSRAAEGRNFEEVILPLRSYDGVHLQYGLGDAVRHADVLVTMFDLRWPLNIVETALVGRTKRRLLWGHGLGRSRLLWPLRLTWARRTDGVILYHRAQVHSLTERGMPAQKVFVAPNTVALPTASLPPQMRDSILFVGRLERRKRIDVLIDAFARLKAKGLDAGLRLNLVGDGSQRPYLEKQVASLGIRESVRFHGLVLEESRLADLFGRAVLYASPGSTGLGLLHAFAHGVPAVIGDGVRHGPEAQDLIPGVNGLLAAANPEDFSRGLYKLVSDPGLRDRMGRAAAEFVRTERRLKDMVDGFMEALDGKP